MDIYNLLLDSATARCHQCNERLPLFQSPLSKTNKQWWTGGSTCNHCGCECHANGAKVQEGHVVSNATKLKLIATLAAIGIPAIALLMLLLS